MNPTLIGRARRRIFTPDGREVTFATRGFSPVEAGRQANLEAIGSTFLEGFGYGMAGRGIRDIESSLDTVERAKRGFAYEGCAMALAIRDGLRPAGRHWIRDFLAGPAAPHIYMAYIGVGWAMARLPRMRWRAIMPQDRLLQWLALDGYGFHQAYFQTAKYVTGQYQASIPLFRPAGYANRAVDQGIGRALWFIHGGVVPDVAAAVRRFADRRRADLWSGVGLAATFAGGCGPEDLAVLRREAGGEQDHLAQGAVFAAKARSYAGFVPDYTHAAIAALTGVPTESAVALADDTAVEPGGPGSIPDYEIWRGRVRTHFAAATNGSRRA
jgi:hypothetical protein